MAGDPHALCICDLWAGSEVLIATLPAETWALEESSSTQEGCVRAVRSSQAGRLEVFSFWAGGV